MATKRSEVDRCYEAWKASPNDETVTALFNALDKQARVILARRFHQVDVVLAVECATRVWEQLHRFVLDGRARFSTWASRAIWNHGTNKIQRDPQFGESTFVSTEDLTEENHPVDTLDLVEDKIFLKQVVARLKPEDQQMVWMKLDGYTNKEIADVLGLATAHAVDCRWNKLPDKVRQLL